MSGEVRLAELSRIPAAVELLVEAGQDAPAAASKAKRLVRCARALSAAGADGEAPAIALFVPGRIEVLGKHTDYAGGRSIIAAVEQGFCLVAAVRDDPVVAAIALDLGDRCAFELSAELEPMVGHWSNYPMTVARRIARNFPGPLRGANIAFTSDLPIAAGMSSSSALMVAVFLALSQINSLPRREEYRREVSTPEDLAGYLGTVENGQSFGGLSGDKGVGTFGGSEDHVAMLCSRAGMLAQYSYCPVRLERRIEMPAGFLFAVAASGVAAEKTGEAMARYNRASRLASSVTEVWNRASGRDDPHIAAALASDEPAKAAERIREALADRSADETPSPEQLLGRFEHFFVENEQIIPAAGDALAAGADGLAEFGRLVDRSQEAAETLLGNQVPQTCFLARTARSLGAAAASGFGAGFGGSVWALVHRDRADALLAEWARRYGEAFPAEGASSSFFLTRCGPASFRLGSV